MESAEEYDKRAAEAGAHAERARDPDLKRQWLDLADKWRAMAEQARRSRR